MKRSSILQSLLRCLVISQVLIWLAGLLSFSVVALWFMRNEIDHIQERQLQALAQRAELFNSGLLSLGDTISILRATTATHRFLYRVTRLSDGSSTGDLACPRTRSGQSPIHLQTVRCVTRPCSSTERAGGWPACVFLCRAAVTRWKLSWPGPMPSPMPMQHGWSPS